MRFTAAITSCSETRRRPFHKFEFVRRHPHSKPLVGVGVQLACLAVAEHGIGGFILKFIFNVSAITASTMCRHRLVPSQQPRQLSNIHRNAPRIIEGKRLGYLYLLLCLSCIDVGQRLSVSVENLVSARRLLDLPGCRDQRDVIGALLFGSPASLNTSSEVFRDRLWNFMRPTVVVAEGIWDALPVGG